MKLFATLTLASLILAPSAARANVGEAYGFGSRTSALAGAGAAWGFDGFAAYSNPAGLAFAGGDKRLVVSYSLLLMHPSFTPISNVVIENKYTSDKDTVGDVDNSYRDTFGQTIGLSYRLFPDTYNLTAGLVVFLPVNQAAYMDSGETFVPEYFMYRARTQRPQIDTGIGVDLGKGFHLGVGTHFGFGLTGSATAFLQTDSSKPSTIRFASSLKPKAAPYFGFLYTGGGETNDAFSLGTVFRLPVSSSSEMFLKSGARAFGSFAALDFNFTATSALFYDPMSIEIGSSIKESDAFRTYVQFEYQFWNKFEAPALNILDPKNDSCKDDPTACPVNISAGKNPAFNYRAILVPRIAQEIKNGPYTFRIGYAYRPSIMTDLPTGIGNYLDPAKHMITAGVGFEFKKFLGFEIPTDLDFHFAAHHLVTQHIDKTAGDENGDLSDKKIGSPGYDAGGNIIGGGVSLTLVF